MTEQVHNDLPRDEALRRTNDLARMGWTVHFKYTCAHCGERCVLKDANILYERGECHVCGRETELDRVGFLLVRLG